MPVVKLFILPLWSLRNLCFPDPMKLFSYFLALASIASLALGFGGTLTIGGALPALLGFAGFAFFGLAAGKINPNI